MKLEQPKGQNRLRVQSPSWAARWRLFLSLSPFILFPTMMMVEAIVLSWLTGKFMDGIVWRLVIGAGVPLVLFFLLIVFSPDLDNLGRRTLEFRDKGLVVQPHRVGRIPWECVVAFQLEPLTGHPDMALLNVANKPAAKRGLQRKWSIVLDRATQVGLLLGELNLRRQSRPSILVQEFAEPLPQRPARRLRGLWPYMAGLFLLVNGMGPLMASFKGATKVSDHDADRRELHPSAARLLQEHFHSIAEFHRFLFISGSIITGGGAVCMGCAMIIMRRETKGAEAQAELDFANESARARNC